MTNATSEHDSEKINAVKERLDLIDKLGSERADALSAQLAEANKRGSERADALSAQLAEANKRGSERADALTARLEEANKTMSSRVEVIENKWYKTKVSGAGFVAAFALLTGWGVSQIIKESKSQAVAEITPLATKAAKDKVDEIIPKTVSEELDKKQEKAKETVGLAERSKDHILEMEKTIQAQLAGGIVEKFRDDITFLKDSVQSRAGIAFKVDQTVVLDENAVAGAYIVTYTLARNGSSNCADLVIISPKDTTHHPNNPPFVAFARYNEKSNGYQIKSVDYSVVQMPSGKFQLVATVHSFDKDAEKPDGTARYVRLR